MLYVAGDELPGGESTGGAVYSSSASCSRTSPHRGVLKGFFLFPRPVGAGDPPVVRWVPSVLQWVFADITTADGPGSRAVTPSEARWCGAGSRSLLERENGRVRGWHSRAPSSGSSRSRAARLRGPLPRRRRGRSRSRAGGTGALYVVADRGTVPGRVLLVSVGVGVLGLLQGPPSSVAALGKRRRRVARVARRRRFDAGPPVEPPRSRCRIRHPRTRRGFFALLYVIEPPLLVAFFGSAIAVGSTVAAPLAGEKLGGEYGA